MNWNSLPTFRQFHDPIRRTAAQKIPEKQTPEAEKESERGSGSEKLERRSPYRLFAVQQQARKRKKTKRPEPTRKIAMETTTTRRRRSERMRNAVAMVSSKPAEEDDLKKGRDVAAAVASPEMSPDVRIEVD